MNKIQEIIKALKSNGMKNIVFGDSDETTVIAWENPAEIKKALEGLKFEINILPNAGYYGGTLIVPKEKK